MSQCNGKMIAISLSFQNLLVNSLLAPFFHFLKFSLADFLTHYLSTLYSHSLLLEQVAMLVQEDIEAEIEDTKVCLIVKRSPVTVCLSLSIFQHKSLKAC